MRGIIALITIIVFGLGSLFGAVGNTGDIGFFAKCMRKVSVVFLSAAIIATIVLKFFI